jgi:hypothetical protein
MREGSNLGMIWGMLHAECVCVFRGENMCGDCLLILLVWLGFGRVCCFMLLFCPVGLPPTSSEMAKFCA